MAAEDKLLKLQQYQRTQQFIHDAKFEKATQLPMAVGAEGASMPKSHASTSFLLNRTRDSVSRHDMSLIREHLKVFSELDPANPYYSTLLERIDHGDRLSWKEFEQALNRFSSNDYYLVKLQDEINNAQLAGAKEIPVETASERPSNIVDFPQPEKPADEPPLPPSSQPPTPPSSDLSTPNLPRFYETPRPPLIQRIEGKMSQASSRPVQTVIPGAQSTRIPNNARQRISASNRAIRHTKGSSGPRRTLVTRPPTQRSGLSLFLRGNGSGGYLPAALSGNGNQYITRRLINRYAPKRLVSGLNRYSTWESNLYKTIANKTGVTTLNNLRSDTYRWIGNTSSRLVNGSWGGLKGGTGKGVQAIARGVSQAGSLIGRTVASAGVSGPILLLILIIFLGALALYSLQQKEFEDCGKSGAVNMIKSAKKNAVAQRETIQYELVITYRLNCLSATIDNVEVRDPLPPGTTYIENSDSATSAELTDLPNIDGDDSEGFNPSLIENPNNVATTGLKPTLEGNILVWKIGTLSPNIPVILSFAVKAPNQDVWLANQATVTYRTSEPGTAGSYTDAIGLLPSPMPPPVADWENVKSQIIAAINRYPELIDVYKVAGEQSGVAWQVLAGLHFVETGSNPRPNVSLVSGREIGQREPDINPTVCEKGTSGPGIPIPMGGGCGFANQTESAIYAANHLAGKISKVPSTFAEAVEAMSRYNGGGNANCGEGLDYSPCPPQFKGEDDPYGMADFDESHSSKKMYVIFCSDGTKCNPIKLFARPGAMGVVRALVEAGI